MTDTPITPATGNLRFTGFHAGVTITVGGFTELQLAVRELANGRSAMAFRGYHAAGDEEREPEALVTGLERACKAIDGASATPDFENSQ